MIPCQSSSPISQQSLIFLTVTVSTFFHFFHSEITFLSFYNSFLPSFFNSFFLSFFSYFILHFLLLSIFSQSSSSAYFVFSFHSFSLPSSLFSFLLSSPFLSIHSFSISLLLTSLSPILCVLFWCYTPPAQTLLQTNSKINKMLLRTCQLGQLDIFV